jgi:hypothetical protein
MASFVSSHFDGLNASTSANAVSHRSVSKPVPVVDLSALQSASRVLHDQFVKDAQVIPDLGEMLTARECHLFISFTLHINLRSRWTVVRVL